MPNKRIRYAGKTYAIDTWGGATNVDTPPTSTENSPVNKKLRGTEDSSEVVHRRFTDTSDNMGDTDMGSGEMSAMKSSGGDGSKIHRHETKILNLKPHYGLPDATTVVLPYTAYLAVVSEATNNASGCQHFSFRTTSLADILVTSLTDPTAGATLSAGIYHANAGTTSTWPNPDRAFPNTTAAGTVTGETPAWCDWWAKMYQAYTVLKCEYDVLFYNPRSAVNGDLIIGYGAEVTGTTDGKVYPNTSLSIAEHFPDLKFKICKSSIYDEDQRYVNISGTYYPGQEASHVRNDEDVETWTKYTDGTSLPAPSLAETMRFMVWKAPFNSLEDPQALNVRISLRLTAQFRDLIPALRYPAAQSTVTFTAPTDITQDV